MAPSVRSFALLLALAVAGCHRGPDRYSDFALLLSEGWCGYQIRCGVVGASEADQCTAAPPVVLNSVGDIPAAIARGALRFHSDEAQHCLDQLASASCNVNLGRAQLVLSCGGVLTAGLRTGESCLGGTECESGSCRSDPNQPDCSGACVADQPLGAACGVLPDGSTQSCNLHDAYCDGTCKPRQPVGGACPVGDECQLGQPCLDGVCTTAKVFGSGAVGSACDPGVSTIPTDCARGLYCRADGTCAAQAARGAACARGGCQDGLACVAGSCQPFSDVGKPCTAAAAGSDSGCPSTQSCEDGVCVAAATPGPVGPGQGCQADGDCQSGLYCHANVCDFTAGLDGACSSDAGCAPGLDCFGDRCHATPSCPFD